MIISGYEASAGDSLHAAIAVLDEALSSASQI
jgi:hypothetical protein